MGTIKIERLFDAPVEYVWKALTEYELMKQWYFDLPDFKAVKGHEFRFYGGPSPERQYLHVCTVLDVIENKKLSYSWRYEGYAGNSVVTFELEAKGENTLLRFSHSGLESFPADNADLASSNFEIGWNHIINTALLNFINK